MISRKAASVRVFRWLPRLIVSLFGVFACLSFLMLLSIGRNILADLSTNQCAESVASIESFAHFELPPSGEMIRASCWGMQGWGVEANFTIDSADLNVFLASTLIETPLISADIPPTLDYPGLQPESLTTYLYGRYDSTNLSQEIVIDTSGPERYTVYIMVLGGD